MIAVSTSGTCLRSSPLNIVGVGAIQVPFLNPHTSVATAHTCTKRGMLTPLVYLPPEIAVTHRGVCSDLELLWLRLRRHTAAIALGRLLSDVGLDIEFARMHLEPSDSFLVWECISETVFEMRKGTIPRVRDPFRPKLRFVASLRKRGLWHLI